MPTEKQKASIRAIFEKGKRTRRGADFQRVEDDGFEERSGIDYLGNRELKEIKERLERGGYEQLG